MKLKFLKRPRGFKRNTQVGNTLRIYQTHPSQEGSCVSQGKQLRPEQMFMESECTLELIRKKGDNQCQVHSIVMESIIFLINLSFLSPPPLPERQVHRNLGDLQLKCWKNSIWAVVWVACDKHCDVLLRSSFSETFVPVSGDILQLLSPLEIFSTAERHHIQLISFLEQPKCSD